ncbi:CTD kinase subunit gamma [Penicillium rolfsii]|nr:CTD kinase subunit gamma [Penicillium rolfsii]
MAVDPFEVRMRFTQQLQHLSASVTSSQKAAHYALKHRDWDEDLHSCILEQLERASINNMNCRANIMFFIEQLCEMATKEDHLDYVRMIQRDILRIVDAVVPPDGSGAANVKHVRRVLGNLQNKEILTTDSVTEIDAALRDRDTHPEHYNIGEDGARDETSHGIRPDKRQIEQRIEEDRERNKRERESFWIMPEKDLEEWEQVLHNVSEIDSDDFSEAEEHAEEHSTAHKRACRLFARSESEETLADPAGASAATTSDMVTATRRGTVSSQPTEEPIINGVSKQGKRKAQPVTTEKTNDKQSKRRKRNSLEAENKTMDKTTPDAGSVSATDEDSAPKKHFRFGSEDPEPIVPEPQLESKLEQDEDEDEENDSDDEAPETIDNSAQLMKIKEQARKQEKAKQQEEQLKREKRRKLDETRKLQAKSKPKEITAPSEDIHSESTTTVQGDNTEDARRRALPALLPDDILNAEPVARPPTPPLEDKFGFAIPKKSNKLRFLEKTEKPPKDVQVGDVTIRVLDAPSTRQSSKAALPPKASKHGRGLKEGWLKQQKSTAHVNGLRRTAGSSSGFKRR